MIQPKTKNDYHQGSLTTNGKRPKKAARESKRAVRPNEQKRKPKDKPEQVL